MAYNFKTNESIHRLLFANFISLVLELFSYNF